MASKKQMHVPLWLLFAYYLTMFLLPIILIEFVIGLQLFDIMNNIVKFIGRFIMLVVVILAGWCGFQDLEYSRSSIIDVFVILLIAMLCAYLIGPLVGWGLLYCLPLIIYQEEYMGKHLYWLRVRWRFIRMMVGANP